MLVSQLSAPALPRVDEHKKLGVSLQEPPRITRWPVSSSSMRSDRGARLFIFVQAHFKHVSGHIRHPAVWLRWIYPYGGCAVEPAFKAIASRRVPAARPRIFAL